MREIEIEREISICIIKCAVIFSNFLISNKFDIITVLNFIVWKNISIHWTSLSSYYALFLVIFLRLRILSRDSNAKVQSQQLWNCHLSINHAIFFRLFFFINIIYNKCNLILIFWISFFRSYSFLFKPS